MSTPFTLRWGILATGGIAKTFAKDLASDPSSRDVHDVRHIITAAASSNSAERARTFLTEVNAPQGAAAYGSYEQLVQDPNCDIIYIASPHSHHFQHGMLCLLAGKNVLCEKPLSVNASQAKLLVATARRKLLFLMEAMWTRYLPLSLEVEKVVAGGRIGKVHRVMADVSFGDDVEQTWGTEHRMVNLSLAGGALLDLGVYPLSWIFHMLYHLQEAPREAPSVKSFMTKYPATGADEATTVILDFPRTAAHGIALTSIRVSTDPGEKGNAGPAVRIQGTQGEIQISPPAFRPEHFRVVTKDGEFEDVHLKIDAGRGLFHEADEAARCIKEGKKESGTVSLDETVVVMETLDEIRLQGGLKFPSALESAEYKI